nr:hypothetical protein Iba_chr09aCG1840 [Ipomoea batatas]GMD31592.1 hypothetical protein Iba_chr09bCG0310 [Ipomoea batatas]
MDRLGIMIGNGFTTQKETIHNLQLSSITTNCNHSISSLAYSLAIYVNGVMGT